MAKVTKVCTVDGCSARRHGRGLCATHYRQQVRAAAPPCDVDGCEKPTVAHGLCRMHYMRQRRGGDVGGAEFLRRTYSVTSLCEVDGCDVAPSNLGLCGVHYRRFRRYGDANVQPLRMSFGGANCFAVGCSRKAVRKWLCELHHYKMNPDEYRLRQARYRASTAGKLHMTLTGARRRTREAEADMRVVDARDWLRLVDQYRGCCAYCGASDKPLTREHIIPLARGGRHAIGNLLPVCGPCNYSKADRLLVEWRAWKQSIAAA